MPESSASHKRVRVCLVGPSLDILGGQAVQAQRLLLGLGESDRLDVSFLAVNPRLPGALRALQKIKYVRTAATSLAYVTSLFRAAQRHDVIHAFSASYWSFLIAPLPALIIGKLFGKQTVLNYRSGEADDHLRHWRSAVPLMRQFATAIVVPSGYLVQVFETHGLVAQSIANFVPIDQLPYRRRERLRPEFFSNRNLEPLYNVACTIRAFGRIQQDHPDASLTVAGDGSQRRELEELVVALGIRNVRFIGRVSPAEMGSHYDSADIYLNSPNIDNMPGSIIEAFACGIPVVSTNAGGIPYVVKSGETGLLVESNDHEAMAVACLKLLEDSQLALSIADRARAQCVSRYVWPAVKLQWEELYCRLATTC